jgi:transposase
LTYLRFLKRVVRFNSDKKVFWIADNARYHHAKVVKEWVELNSDKVELFFLPAYSPEFNAVEHIWRMTKRKATHNRHFTTLKQLHSKVFRRFNRYQGNPTSLKSAITRFLPPARKRACKT